VSLIILDRDGVINHDSDDFIKSPAEWEPIEGSLEAIARLNHAGYSVVVITNQPGIAERALDVDTLSRIHSKMRRMLAQVGGKIESILYCPHGTDDNCECHKPEKGKYTELATRLRLDLTNVPAVGDSLQDIRAAQAAGAMPILVKSAKGELTFTQGIPDDIAVYDNLSEAVSAILDTAL